MAIRMKIQRHSGPQERVDLAFAFPSLEPPDLPKHVSADAIEETMQPIDRIFLSIAAHHDSLAPDTRLRTIYPRYLEQASAPGQDGVTRRAFRDGRIGVFRPRHHANLLVAEQTLEIGVEFPDFLNVHGSLQYDLGFGKFLGRDEANRQPNFAEIVHRIWVQMLGRSQPDRIEHLIHGA